MTAPIRLLLVDDHPVIRAAVTALLSLYPEFAIIAQATNAVEAVRLHATHQPDLTLMDVRLPGQDGIQALCTILSTSPQARIVMLSADAFAEDVTRARASGACGFLSKTSQHSHFARALRDAHRLGCCHPFTP